MTNGARKQAPLGGKRKEGRCPWNLFEYPIHKPVLEPEEGVPGRPAGSQKKRKGNLALTIKTIIFSIKAIRMNLVLIDFF